MKHRLFILLAIAFCLLANTVYASPHAQAMAQVQQGGNSLAPMMQRVMPAIVNIVGQGTLPAIANPRAKRTSDHPKPRKFTSIGSGVIVDVKQGYILTNAHVISGSKTINVTLSDGRSLKAKLIGADSLTDIAVLQVKEKNLQTLPLADSTKARVGDFVVAIGNPFGLGLRKNHSNQTATFGIISALKRHDPRINNGLENFIQTDAAINPGNSGGALINMQGELIGINTALFAARGSGNIGIGFAIPTNMARKVMQQLIKYGSIHRGVMGIYVQPLTPELASAFNIPNTHGALITQVNHNSPAQKAGLQPGDLLQTINNTTITDAAQVRAIIGLVRVGDPVHLKILRNGKMLNIKAAVVDLKKHQERLQSENPFLFGLGLEDFNRELPAHGHVKGVQIVGATENSAGWRAGIRPGDIIISANKKKVASLEQLLRSAEKSHEQLLLHILRGQGALFLVVK